METKEPLKPKRKRASVDSLENYRFLLDNIQDGVFILQEGKVCFANEALATMLGYKKQEMIGLEFVKLVAPEERKIASDLQALGQGAIQKRQKHECRMVRKRGRKRVSVHMSIQPILYQGRAALTGMIKDVSGLRSALAAVVKSEKKYRELYDNLRDGFASTNRDGRIVECNTAFQQMLGYPLHELYQLSYKNVTPKKWHAMEQKVLERQVFTRGYSDLYEKEYVRNDGSILPVELRTYLLRNDAGKPLGMWAFVRDITERKRAEEVLRHGEERYRKLFEDSRDAIVITDRQGRFLDLNKAALDLFGHTRQEIKRKNFRELYVDPHAAVEFQQAVEEKGSVRDYEVKLWAKDGREMDCLFTVTAKRGNDGAILGYQGIIRDITAHKKMQEALRESEKKYKELSITDDLTKLYNARYFYEQLKSEIDRALRYHRPLSLLMIDVDNFKNYNDRYGHPEGDKVLAMLGEIIRKHARRSDSAYRYGGEEFTMILTETTGENAAVLAERLREKFKCEAFFPSRKEEIHVTISIGVAEYLAGEELSEFIKDADKSMYLAKQQGKDQIYFQKS